MGLVAHQTGRDDEAVSLIGRAIAVKNDDAVYHCNLGVILRRLGRLADATTAYRRAIAVNAAHVDAWFNLGNVLRQSGQTAEAKLAFAEALRLDPGHARAQNEAGVIELELGDLPRAEAAFRAAVELDPALTVAYVNLGVVLLSTGRIEDAIASLETALAIDPQHEQALVNLVWARMETCDWRDAAAPSRLGVLAAARVAAGQSSPIDPFFALMLGLGAGDQLAIARDWSDRLAARVVPLPPLPSPGDADKERRIRIGYLSADFHAHATAHLTRSLYGLHDRSSFEVVAFSYGPDDGSPHRRRVENDCDAFVELAGLPEAECAAEIRAQGIDILVDLKGHTSGGRPGIAARRPAPLQVSYLGFPGTSGAGWLDYLIADHTVAPPGSDGQFREALVRLPDSYQVTDHHRRIADTVPGRADCGLPDEGFVFCCFNHSYKIDPQIFALWMEILGAVPGSVLWLLRASPLAESNLRGAASDHGVNPARLVFAPRLAQGDHLARHTHAGLFLDTHGCNAHTTASDALWAGVPVLTWPGQTFASRVAAGIDHAIGLDELVAPDREAYRRLAIQLASDPGRLTDLRARLAENRNTAPLFDTPRFTRHLESAFRTMWQVWCAGAPPRPFDVPPLP